MSRLGLPSLLLGIVAAGLCLCTPPAPAQAPGERNHTLIVDGGGMFIAVSRSGKTLYGYSTKVGKWAGVAIVNPGDLRVEPTIGSGIGFVAVGRRVHAFSGFTGQWAAIDLPEAKPVRIGLALLRIDDGPRVHIFSGVEGTWSTVDLDMDRE